MTKLPSVTRRLKALIEVAENNIAILDKEIIAFNDPDAMHLKERITQARFVTRALRKELNYFINRKVKAYQASLSQQEKDKYDTRS